MNGRDRAIRLAAACALALIAMAAARAHSADADSTNPHTLCAARSDSILDALADAHYAAAASDFDAALRARYAQAQLKNDYEALPGKYGKLLGRGRAHNGDLGGHPVVMTPLIFERGTLTVEVHCDGDGKVSDLRLEPTQTMH